MLEWITELEDKIKSDPLFQAIVADLHEVADEMTRLRTRLTQLEGNKLSLPSTVSLASAAKQLEQ